MIFSMILATISIIALMILSYKGGVCKLFNRHFSKIILGPRLTQIKMCYLCSKIEKKFNKDSKNWYNQNVSYCDVHEVEDVCDVIEKI